MEKRTNRPTGLIIYQSKSGTLEIKTDRKHETIWLTQDQMASLFDVKKSAISKQLKNIFTSDELEEKSVVSILETTAKDNKIYKIKHFNLDAVLSVGYRINSKRATIFVNGQVKCLRNIFKKDIPLIVTVLSPTTRNFLRLCQMLRVYCHLVHSWIAKACSN